MVSWSGYYPAGLYTVILFRPADTKGGYLDCGYTSTVSTTKNNLLANMPEKTDPHKVNIAMTKNSTNTSSMLNKCKRIYL